MGHLSNIPDNQWRSKSRHYRVSKMNSPTHYFGPERFLGEPPKDSAGFQQYLQTIRNLPTGYANLKAKYHGKANALPAGNALAFP